MGEWFKVFSLLSYFHPTLLDGRMYCLSFNVVFVDGLLPHFSS